MVKSKDVTQEQQEKELQASKRECGQLRREMLAKESILKQRLGEEESMKEVLEQQLRIVEERADALQVGGLKMQMIGMLLLGWWWGW